MSSSLFSSQINLPKALNMGGLLWQCPQCKYTNRHNLPFRGATMASMLGEARRCDHCFCEYILTESTVPEYPSTDHNPPSER